MSTYYRPVRRGPRWSVVAAALSCLPLLLALVFLGYRAHDKADDMPTVEHPLACQNLDTDWTLEWSIWRGWYCQPDFGTKLIPMSASPLPVKVTGGWPAGAPEKAPGWIVFLDPGHQPAFIHVRGAAWDPSHPDMDLRVWPWTGRSYELRGPLDFVFTTTPPLNLRT
jgi:hypothetical protein